ncbi:glycosyltransferase family 4 protein [Microbacterium sp.]|uniref:glycosyltransferase family 4 protein n=1 Tax=Microbacterium sp. TaxID=51671 RepID=UPI00333E5BF8
MRVLIATAWFPTEEHPGTGIFHLRDAELLAQDHDVTILHLGAASDGEEVIGGMPVIRRAFGPASPGSYVRGPRVVRELLAERDLLHTMSFPTLLPLTLSRPQRPWVHTEHWTGLVWPPASLPARWGAAATRRLLRRPDEVVAVGDDLAKAVESVRGAPVARIPNFVRFAHPDRLPPVHRAGEPLRLIGVSGLQPHKGALIAVDALAVLRDRGVDARLRWAGEGAQREELLDRAEEIGVADRLQLLGHVDPEELPELLLASHLFVAPTRFETFGVAIAEALSHGLPVVATGEGGHWAFLPPEASRRAERSPDGLADGIESLLGDVERWPAARIRADAEARFAPAARRAAYAEAYRRAGEAHHRRG